MFGDFVEKAKLQDSRNKFGTIDKVEDYGIPEPLQNFYKYANPIDVEVNNDNFTSIKFYPGAYLCELQNEYDLPKDVFVFATIEGDPFLLKDEKIYMAVHGTGNWKLEIVANSFEEFIMSIF